jgi:hypothetical protein
MLSRYRKSSIRNTSMSALGYFSVFEPDPFVFGLSDPSVFCTGSDPRRKKNIFKWQNPDLKVSGADLDPYQNVTDPQHCIFYQCPLFSV